MPDKDSNIVLEWIIKAENDLLTANVIIKHLPEVKDTAVFHCQQAAEKYLKAYLCLKKIDFSKTHNLMILLDMVDENEIVLDDWYAQAAVLQNYSVEIRYPQGRYNTNEIDTLEAYEAANFFKNNILTLINS